MNFESSAIASNSRLGCGLASVGDGILRLGCVRSRHIPRLKTSPLGPRLATYFLACQPPIPLKMAAITGRCLICALSRAENRAESLPI